MCNIVSLFFFLPLFDDIAKCVVVLSSLLVFSNGRTSGIPILGYLTGTLDVSSTNVRCNGNGMHAENIKKKNKRLNKMTIEIWCVVVVIKKTYIAYTPSNGTFFACCGCLICLTFDAQIHDVISANGAVVNHNI